MSTGRKRRAAARAVIVLGTLVGSLTAFGAAHAEVVDEPATEPPTDPCDVGLLAVNPTCELVSGAVETTQNVVGFVSDPAGYFTDLFIEGAAGMFEGVSNFILESGAVDLTDPAFLVPYATMFFVSLLLSVLQLARVVGWGRTILHQLWAVPGWGLYAVMCILSPVFVHYGLQILDYMIQPFGAISDNSLDRFLTALTTTDRTTLNAFALPERVAVILILAVVLMAVAIILFIELTVRSGLLYVLVLFYPMFALGYIEYKDQASEGRQRLSVYHTIVVGIALIKWVIAVILTLAGSLFVSGDPDKMLVAVGLLIVSVGAPFAIIPLLGFAQVVAAGQAVTGGLSRAARTAVRR